VVDQPADHGRAERRSNTPLLRVETVYSFLERAGLSKTFATLVVGGCFVVAVTLIIYWFFGTELGAAVRATGSNPNMVRAQGVNTNSMIILGLMISNGLVSMAGALLAQYQGFADIQMGIGCIVIGLASLIIGELLFGTRSFKNSLISVILGAVAYRIIIALVLKAGMNPNDLKLFTAITVAICLALPMFRDYLGTMKKSVRSPGKEGI
jgi:putative ABC transport system permease protein